MMHQVFCDVDALFVCRYLQPCEVENFGLLSREYFKVFGPFMREEFEGAKNLHRLWATKDKVFHTFCNVVTEEDFRAWDNANGRYLELRSLDPRNGAYEARRIFYGECHPSWTALVVSEVLEPMKESACEERTKQGKWLTVFRRANPTFVDVLREHPPQYDLHPPLPMRYIQVKTFFDSLQPPRVSKRARDE
jgi:hypothetical protein